MSNADDAAAKPHGDDLPALIRDPDRLFWILAAVRFVVWWALPVLVSRTAPLDMIEGLAWGHEWQPGYWKHPPLAAWLLEGCVTLFGVRLAPLFLLGPACVTLCLWAVWRLARQLVGPWDALVAVLVLDGVYYYGYASPKLNPDLLQLPLWALTVLCLHRAVVARRPWSWVVVGLAAGLGMLAKYYTLALLAPLVLLMLGTPEGRRELKQPGPWLALALAGLVLAPHLYWLVQHDFVPLRYAQGRALAPAGTIDRLAQPLLFLAGQVLTLLPSCLLVWAAGWRFDRASTGQAPGFSRKLVLAAALGPLAFTLAAAVLAGLRLSGGSRENWGTPLWSFVGLLVVCYGPARLDRARRFLTAWSGLVALGAAFYLGVMLLGPSLRGRVDRVRTPGRALAEMVDREWSSRWGGTPVFLGGDNWLAGNAALFSAGRPRVYIELRPERCLWIDEEEFRRHGAIVLWDPRGNQQGYLERLRDRFPEARIQPPMRLTLDEFGGPVSVPVGWAILAPAGAER